MVDTGVRDFVCRFGQNFGGEEYWFIRFLRQGSYITRATVTNVMNASANVALYWRSAEGLIVWGTKGLVK
jgi:hypothetical protein